MNMTTMLKFVDVDAHYGPIQALRNVSLHVNRGEIVSLIGSNGAGKSTLIKTVFGTPRASRGSIKVEGLEVRGRPTSSIASLGVGLVPEGRRIFPTMTVEENLVLGAVSIGNSHLSEDMDRICTVMPILGERKHQRAGTLSGGEQQLVAIGRALMGRPKLLLLDEPSLGLAPKIVAKVFELIQSIAREGVTIFLVEQNAHQALQLADRAYVLVNGEVRFTGTGDDVAQIADVREAYLGSFNDLAEPQQNKQ